jgi:hypothetical protein
MAGIFLQVLLLLVSGLGAARAFHSAGHGAAAAFHVAVPPSKTREVGRVIASCPPASARQSARQLVMLAESRQAALGTGVDMEYRAIGDPGLLQKPPVVFVHGSFHGERLGEILPARGCASALRSSAALNVMSPTRLMVLGGVVDATLRGGGPPMFRDVAERNSRHAADARRWLCATE